MSGAAPTAALLGALAVPFAAAALDNPWSRVDVPAAGAARAIGKYTAGCLAGGRRLHEGAVGLVNMRPQRNRHFGHPTLIDFLLGLGEHMTRNGHGTVLVGDLAMPRGGPTMTNHVSHQSGLDADIWFDLLPVGATLDVTARRTRSASRYVDWAAKRLDPRFGAAQVELVRYTAAHPAVERVFVNPVIKRRLCDTVRDDRSWLAAVRPWWGHADHLHVRLRCPPGEPLCKPQQPVPDGDGCDGSLEWWLTRADIERAAKPKTAPAPRRLPRLPTACQLVLGAPVPSGGD